MGSRKASLRQITEDILCLAAQPSRLSAQIVDLGVLLGRFDSLRVNLHSSDFLEPATEGDAKQTGSTVSVDEVGGLFGVGDVRREDGVSDVRGEGHEDRVVVLEERSSGEGEKMFSNTLVDRQFVVGDRQMLVFGQNRGGRVKGRD